MAADDKPRLEETVVQTPEGIEKTATSLLAFEQEKAGQEQGKSAPDKAGTAAAPRDQAISPATEAEAGFFREMLRNRGEHRYRFEGKLVSGGMGAIHKVLDQDLLRLSAMKVMLPKYKNDPDDLKSFVTEAKITGFLEHPCIIPVHEIGFSRATGIYFTMKLARGEALNSILNELKQGNLAYRERFSVYRLVSIFRKVCDALSFAHSRHIIHQDIKPHNILVGNYGEVLLMDWGIAKYIGDPETESDPVRREMFREISQWTQGEQGEIKGTPTYMSPEQTMGDPGMLDKQSDIFLLGGTLYHMMTLHTPYTGGDVYEVIGKAISGQYTPPQEFSPGWVIPDEIYAIINRAMAFRKQDRYGSVEEMIADIDDFLEGRWTGQEKKTFAPGQLLMREGQAGNEAYIILSGRVEVFRAADGQRVVLGVLHEGDIVGEMALIMDDVRSASVEALEPTEVAVLNEDLFSRSLKRLPPSIGKIIRSLTGRLITANAKINPHLTEDATYFVLQQLRLIYKDLAPVGAGAEAGIPADRVTDEIAENLGIAHQQVVEVLKKAAYLNLITYDGSVLAVPDEEELSRYIRFGKMFSRTGVPGQDGPS